MIAMNFQRDRNAIANEFKERSWDAASGLSPDQLKQDCAAIWAENEKNGIQLRRARVMVYILDHAQLEARPFECFVDQLRHDAILPEWTEEWYRACRQEIKDALNETEDAAACRAFTGERDFGHTCPDWRSLLSLGYPGVLNRLKKAREEAPKEQAVFFESVISVYEAILRYLGRLEALTEKMARETPRMMEIARNLHALREGPPQTLHQALQLSTITYYLQQEMEQAYVRSLGRFDLLYAPFYEADLATGRMTRAQAKELLQYYFYRWNARDVVANIPITLCGRDEQGHDVSSDFTRLVLEAYGELNIISPKFHIRCFPGMREDVLRQVLSLIRAGSNSFVFCNDEQVEAAMQSIGQSARDARDYVMVGCYESTSMGKEVACTCNGRISFPKAVEYALTGGDDMMTGKPVGVAGKTDYASFEDLMEAVRIQLRAFAAQCMKRISLIESLYPRVFSAPIFSGAMACCVEKGRDVFDSGAKYNDSSINAFGIATAADSLAAIRQIVFEEKMMTLPEFTQILRSNWKNQEMLRLRCLKRAPKYGVNDPEVDALAKDLMSTVAHCIDGAPNGRGGVFRLGAFSIDWRLDFGAHTAASADGRRAGESLSKNLCASLGQDTQGVTALIQSASCFDAREVPNGMVLDIVLHQSAVKGEEGLDAMLSLLQTFLRRGGLAIQYNVLDAAVLRRAQAEPEKYPTLQVRLCGWNVLFVNLSRQEQDELILQAQSA